VLIRLPLLALLGLLALTGCATTPPGPRAPQDQRLPVDRLPSVELVTLDGRPARLSQALEGKVALVAVWATWCEACLGELEALGRLSDRAGARGAAVVAVAVGEKRGTVAEFVARRGLRYPQLVDEEFRLADALGQSRVPATLVVDGAGHIVFTGGALDERALQALRAALDAHVALAH
jgi:peroxiredoxin